MDVDNPPEPPAHTKCRATVPSGINTRGLAEGSLWFKISW